MNPVEAVVVVSALGQVPGPTRREMSRQLQALRDFGTSLFDIANATSDDLGRYFGWNASQIRTWREALEIARSKTSHRGLSGIRVATVMDDDAPRWLRMLPASPWVFYRGDLSILGRTTVGFSGQRDAHQSALCITTSLAAEAARSGYTVVSGGARGVDMAAHVAALRAGGATAVIVPQGLHTWKPRFSLVDRRISTMVLAVSEDLPWMPWSTESAMRRNRMIVDLSTVFTVPQAGTHGGSHSTGMYALRQGRVAFVPDLGADFPGNEYLLRNGARPLVSTDGRYDLEEMLSESTREGKPSQALLF